MRFLIQRVSRAQVSVEDDVVGMIGRGLLVLVGIAPSDSLELGRRMIDKTVNLRIFEDANGRMNLSLLDLVTNGGAQHGILAVSQFTLYADARKGRRPSFTNAAAPEYASALMDQLLDEFASTGIKTQAGSFGAHMVVSLENDGPVTILLDSDELFPTSA